MLLVIQGILALVATLRGHGFAPWAVLLAALLVGAGFLLMGVTSMVIYFIIDIVVVILLAGFAFSPGPSHTSHT